MLFEYLLDEKVNYQGNTFKVLARIDYSETYQLIAQEPVEPIYLIAANKALNSDLWVKESQLTPASE